MQTGVHAATFARARLTASEAALYDEIADTPRYVDEFLDGFPGELTVHAFGGERQSARSLLAGVPGQLHARPHLAVHLNGHRDDVVDAEALVPGWPSAERQARRARAALVAVAVRQADRSAQVRKEGLGQMWRKRA